MKNIFNSRSSRLRSFWPLLSLREQLFLLMALALLPMVFILIWSNAQRYNSLRRNELRNEQEIAHGVATTFATFVHGINQQLLITGQAILGLSSYDNEQITGLLSVTAGHLPTINRLNWLSPDGTVLASSMPGAAGHNFAFRPFFQQIIAGSTWAISDLFIGTLTDAPTFTIATAVRDDSGQLIGVLVAATGPDEVRELALSQSRLATGTFAIFDRQGAVVYLSEKISFTWEERQRWRESDPLLQRVLTTDEAQVGIITPAMLNEECIAARVPIDGVGWFAGASRSSKVAFAPARQAMARDMTLAVLMTTVAFLLAYHLAGNIAGSLRQLENDARLLGGGHFLPGGDVRAPGEVESLRETLAGTTTSLLLAKRRAEEASRAKSDFLGNMSHELRTPMTVIMGVQEYLAGSLQDQEQEQLLQMATTSAERLLAIIDDLLDISRIEAGRLRLNERPFEVREPVQSAVTMFAKKAEEKGVRLHWKVAPEVPPHAHGDPDRLGQVMVNLIGNAVKFTEGGEIAVQVDRAGDNLVVSVRDTGIGIPSDQVEHIFEPFTQADSSITRKYGGTGLGLAISKELVQLMGGSISLESEQGRGSTFSFALPLLPAHPALSPGPSSERAQRKLRTLVAEDDPMVRTLVQMILERQGLEVRLAENGREAVAKWQQGGTDLILMDLQMPEVDGLEATRQIRELEGGQGRRTWIFALTAHARQEDRERCLASGMDGFLAKPLCIEELNSMIEKFACGGVVNNQGAADRT